MILRKNKLIWIVLERRVISINRIKVLIIK